MHVYCKTDFSGLISQSTGVLSSVLKFFTKSKIFEKRFFEFLVISQELFELQRRVIPHFNSLEELV